jgi:hypothetical protein
MHRKFTPEGLVLEPPFRALVGMDEQELHTILFHRPLF